MCSASRQEYVLFCYRGNFKRRYALQSPASGCIGGEWAFDQRSPEAKASVVVCGIFTIWKRTWREAIG